MVPSEALSEGGPDWRSELGTAARFPVSAPLFARNAPAFRSEGPAPPFSLSSQPRILDCHTMFYTYVLKSERCGEHYRGHTSDLKQRLAEHNAGKCTHTSKFAPWRLKFYAAFETVELAERFERYLKSGSGHAFAKRHLGI